jgi:hypothetical protein
VTDPVCRVAYPWMKVFSLSRHVRAVIFPVVQTVQVSTRVLSLLMNGSCWITRQLLSIITLFSHPRLELLLPDSLFLRNLIALLNGEFTLLPQLLPTRIHGYIQTAQQFWHAGRKKDHDVDGRANLVQKLGSNFLRGDFSISLPTSSHLVRL